MGIIPVGRGIIVTSSTSRNSKSSGREVTKEEFNFIYTSLGLCFIISIFCFCRWFFKFRHIRKSNYSWSTGTLSFGNYIDRGESFARIFVKLICVTVSALTLVFIIICLISKVIF